MPRGGLMSGTDQINSLFQTLWIDKKFAYDGTQLRTLFAYLEHRVLGNSCVAWAGPCDISFDHMVDGEDLLEQSPIRGSLMLHFIIESFDGDLFSAVCLQRLFASIVRDVIFAQAQVKLLGTDIQRSGDDLYWQNKKLSISIASRARVSNLIHFAINISNEGTPVPTASLEDFSLEPKKFALECMRILANEYSSSLLATRKVKPL